MTTLKNGERLPGMFISFEGMDGTGKSSQARMLSSYLKALGVDVVLTREPGGTQGAEEIRQLLLTGDIDRWSPETEILMFTAARRDHVEKLIIPALAAGKVVITDRFADSTRAYQGADNWKNVEIYDQLHDLMIPLEPDLTMILDMDPKKCLDRSLMRLGASAEENPDDAVEDRMESFGLSFQESLNSNFERIALMYPERCSMIDADGDMETVMSRVLGELTRRGMMPCMSASTDRIWEVRNQVEIWTSADELLAKCLYEDDALCIAPVHNRIMDMSPSP